MENRNYERPGKIFVFGNLRLETPYDPKGKVYWNYHVAPAYRIGSNTVVIDIAIEPTRPLGLSEWISRISDDPSKVKIIVCDTYAYSPANKCWGDGRSQERATVQHLEAFLPDEWNRIKKAGLKPEELLGENPPWANFLAR
jgi:hypothetical protein